MVRVTEELALSPEHVTLYRTTDPLLGHLPILIFHGPSTTANYTFNSSRVQVHIYTLAGFQSFPRVTISPNSPFYNVVNHLPREFQVDEIYRALAFGLYKYFHELPEAVKSHIRQQFPTTKGRRPGSSPTLFGEQHAADIAQTMTQHISNVDIDLVLPPGSIIPLQPVQELEELPEDEDEFMDPTLRQYGMYTPLIKLFGEPMFLPTSRLKRAPSKPTALNRSKSFTKDQKVELRRKLAELMDTEERYVFKMNELVKHIADEYRQKAKTKTTGSFSPTIEDVEKLFPRSSDRILQVNTAFMQELRKVMDDTEEEAVKDIESGTTTRVGVSGSILGKSKDPSGAMAMAKVMMEWFPQFTDCYQDYIRASQHFPQLITAFVGNQSSFSQRVAATGEQHLRSILIEPVQRLPRYSLVIDQIVNCLPMTHPALQPMLKARDIIASICSMDEPLADKPQITTRLRNMIESWPGDLEPKGRLILAVDFSELPAPYQADAPIDIDTGERAGIFLLFSDCIVMVKKLYGGNMHSRDLLREIDKPSAQGLLMSMTNAAGGQASYELAFAGWHGLANVRFTESADGRLVWMTSTKEMNGAHAGEHVTNPAITSRCFLLQEAYEGRATKWLEDIVKARVEGRFGEVERENPSWTLRSVRMPDTGLGIFAAVFQEGLDQLIEGRKEPAPIRIVVDHEKGTKQSPIGHYGVEIVSDVKTGDMQRKVVIITVGLSGKKSTDDVALEDFLPTLARRVIQLLSTQHNVSNPGLAPALVNFHTKILRGLNLTNRVEKTRSFLASSPVKMLTSFLGGGNSTENLNSPKHQPRTPVTPLYPPPLSRSNSSAKDAGSLYGSARSRDNIKLGADDDRPENPLVRLEQTFTGYMASLHSRKGNFIGRLILNRGAVDELSVNDLYNKLIESPFDIDTSSDLTTDVVFVAFEKFVKIAWREQMGPIMSMKALDALQARAAKRLPGDFADFVHFLFSDMAPQNRRAFTALIKLLADLLDGCGNDGDRGALTLAFAELLVDDGSAHDYINLLDLLVDDCDRIFDTGPADFGPLLLGPGGSAYEKLGFDTLLRQNSKTEADTRSSVWRSLSKHGGTNGRNPATGESSSLSRASIARAKSIDMGMPTMPNKQRRPGSRDRPPIAGAFDDSYARPVSSQRLETIGEPENEDTAGKTSRRKRRSSLSDLKTLMAAASLEDDDESEPEQLPPALQPLSRMRETSQKFNSGPRIPSPSSRIPTPPGRKPSPSGTSTNPSTSLSRIPISPLMSPTKMPMSPSTNGRPRPQKENLSESMLQTSKKSSPPRTGTVRKGHGRVLPLGDSPLSPERPTSSPTKTNSGKLRLQSPQKLRERLQTEKQAVESVDANLQSELSRITADMARMNSSLPRSAMTEIKSLSESMTALETTIPSMVQQLTKQHEKLQRDMDNTLRATEAKVREIDQLYKESTAENELLYEKFNTELARIVRALKGKSGEKEEIMTKMKEATEETARVKKENARLRREMASLRSMVKGATADAA
ncbi:Rho guanine nucleotide exchange factor gef2 [Apiospora phragmitis]|uniref:Rho guanine nucleotide exchange factor gef2 n=1 Tax=Apiospora phragmitis TaxID=2905665 RepID=A0ABR1X5T4_9PEZI